MAGDCVSLLVPAGQRRAVIGPNGAGKTTLFNAVTGAVRATSGRMLLARAHQARLSLFGPDRLSQAEADRATEALRLSRLDGAPDRLVRELSYGEQRQLEVAMALATRPKLLLDEPAAGLSPSERGVASDIIRALPRSLTVVLIEHDMDLAPSLVDWVTVLDSVCLLVEAAPDAIRGDPRAH